MLAKILWFLGRLLLILCAISLLAFAGMFLLLPLAMFGTEFAMNVAVQLGLTVLGGFAIYLAMLVFGLLDRRRRGWYLVAHLVVCALVLSGHLVARARYNAVPVVRDSEVDLAQYEPFAKNTQAARLDRSASLQIKTTPPRVDGATALYPLYAAFVQATYPPSSAYPIGDSLVRCSKTPEAYRRLIDGEVDIIFVARPSQEQREAARHRGVTLNLTPIGREAFVFFVNAENPVTGLTREQIQRIYSGAIRNWKQVGGRDQAIRAFQRPENSGSQTMLQKIMKGRRLVKPPLEDVPREMGEIIEKAADYRNFDNAIGFSFLYYTTEMVRNNKIRLLKIDGVYPNRESVRNGTYPFAADFYAVTAGSKNPNVAPFIKWILSKEGQKLVEKTGYTPIDSH